MTNVGMAAFSLANAHLMCAPFSDRCHDLQAHPPAFDLPSPHTTLHPLRHALTTSHEEVCKFSQAVVTKLDNLNILIKMLKGPTLAVGKEDRAWMEAL